MGIAILSFAGTSMIAADKAPSSAVARWPFEFQEGDYVFHADFDLRERPNLIGEIQRLPQDIADQLQITIAHSPVHLLLFSTQNNYRNYMRTYFPELPERRALFVKRRGPGMVFAYDNKEMDVDLRHETTHALLNESLTYVPLWLDEGLAEYFEVPHAERAQTSAHMKFVRLRATLGQVRSIESLEAVDDLANMGGSEYRDAWSWVHFLLHHSDATRACLSRFLQDIQSGLPPGPLSRRLAAEVPDYRSQYLKHFRHFY